MFNWLQTVSRVFTVSAGSSGHTLCRNLPSWLLACLCLVSQGWACRACAQTPQHSAPSNRQAAQREIFVPFDELEVLLSNAPERVFISRQEFERLKREANPAEIPQPPFAIEILSAEYQARVQGAGGVVRGNLLIESARDGLQAIELRYSGVGLQAATLDGQPASLAQAVRAVYCSSKVAASTRWSW